MGNINAILEIQRLSDFTPGQLGYIQSYSANTSTQLIMCLEIEEGSAMVLAFSEGGIETRVENASRKAIALIGDVRLTLPLATTPTPKAPQIPTGKAMIGCYTNHIFKSDIIIGARTGSTERSFAGDIYFNFSQGQLIELAHGDSYWWPTATIQYRKSDAYHWEDLFTI